MITSTDPGSLPEQPAGATPPERRPRILVTTWRRQGQTFGPALRDMYGVEVQYPHLIARAGGLPLLALPDRPEAAGETLAGFAGLVLIGGEDVAAETSGAELDTIGENASYARDQWEIALLRAALAGGLPVLAICRGLQILNVALGGTLHGEIANDRAHPPVPDDIPAALAYRHPVTIGPGSLLAAATGATRLDVNSLHHQAIDTLGGGLVVTARADDDTVEGVELPDARWCVGVQWHPELLDRAEPQERLAAAFVAACR